MNKITKTFQYGNHQVTLETGHIARQTDSAVMVRMGETALLVTVVAEKEPDPNRDFSMLPLTINYQEKSYAAGKVPGGYFKREGRPTEKETLTSRLIDRPLRPLFPEGFNNEVQVIATLMSLDPEISSDVPAIIGASAVLALSGIPFNGPLAAARVGYKDGQYLLNPSANDLKTSRLNLVVAGTQNAVLMVESEADQLSEEEMLGAVLFGHEQMQVVIQAIKELATESGGKPWDWQPAESNVALLKQIEDLAREQIESAYQIQEKLARQIRLAEIREAVVKQLCTAEEKSPDPSVVKKLVHDIESKIVRQRILAGEPRIDGRDTETVRPISIELDILPRTHGSVLFTRGETQALVVATLGTVRDAQAVDDLEEADRRDNFILHYNFLPFCVGEIGFISGPKRREVGHGKLAKRALEAVIPDQNEFPYVLRVVSEITESNGSSSMATVCGSSLALMAAGVPIQSAVAGIAMGLIKEEEKFAILTDILGDEDHLGDMDFKVAGTFAGVTALQMDIKIYGITKEIMEIALEQAKQARLHILNEMNKALTAPRVEVAKYAPRILTIKINPDKIRDVIGKGGATIRELAESTQSTIDISEDGIIKIAATNISAGEEARHRIEQIVAEVEIGQVYEGSVVKLTDFGAFVSVLPGRQGLVHISQIAEERVTNIRDYLSEGQVVRVKVIDIDRQGRIRLSMKSIDSTENVS